MHRTFRVSYNETKRFRCILYNLIYTRSKFKSDVEIYRKISDLSEAVTHTTINRKNEVNLDAFRII